MPTSGIDELTVMALGVVGLSFGDFCRLTFGEFEAVMKAHNEAETIRQLEKVPDSYGVSK
ncbi:MAG: hypothetical protein K2L11_08080 [Muribaculaceae bacterium]|nr:hypothetical protein [Muribaculaceae bacterium]